MNGHFTFINFGRLKCSLKLSIWLGLLPGTSTFHPLIANSHIPVFRDGLTVLKLIATFL